MKNHKFDGGRLSINSCKIALLNFEETLRIAKEDEVEVFEWCPNQRAHKDRGKYHRIVARRVPGSVSYGKFPNLNYLVDIDGSEYKIAVNYYSGTVKILKEIDREYIRSTDDRSSARQFKTRRTRHC